MSKSYALSSRDQCSKREVCTHHVVIKFVNSPQKLIFDRSIALFGCGQRKGWHTQWWCPYWWIGLPQDHCLMRQWLGWTCPLPWVVKDGGQNQGTLECLKGLLVLLFPHQGPLVCGEVVEWAAMLANWVWTADKSWPVPKGLDLFHGGRCRSVYIAVSGFLFSRGDSSTGVLKPEMVYCISAKEVFWTSQHQICRH